MNSIRLAGVVERITFHNPENGWSVLKVSSFNEPGKLVTVVIHQAKVFAGSSMEFWGNWNRHPQHGDQFKAERAIEKKPASAAALEKYLGSGLIKGVGPKTATKIVKFFKEKTIEVFEERIDDLLSVPGIAHRKLHDIKVSWEEHKAIRDVMLFLQSNGLSTLFAVKIYKFYGNQSIETVSKNPYRLAKDIYGIGFFSADRVALAMGFERYGEPRIEAAIKHVLQSSREEGHCYLTEAQIIQKTSELLAEKSEKEGPLKKEAPPEKRHPTEVDIPSKILNLLQLLAQRNEIKTRWLPSIDSRRADPRLSLEAIQSDLDQKDQVAYYSNSLFFDEQYVANRIKNWIHSETNLRLKPGTTDWQRIQDWLKRYCLQHQIQLSSEQQASVFGIVGRSFSILTGGPGCGKTTTTRAVVKLLQAMKLKVLLAAPTGRAAQRMSEVIGTEAKTIHRLLEVDPTRGGFKKGEEDPLNVDFLIVDECSMLDINLAAALLKAVPKNSQVLWIGDPDQLPSVGAGNVLYDLLQAACVPRFSLNQVFRQAEESLIIRFAHQMNQGQIPKIDSPFHQPQLWNQKAGCLFIDSEEATQDQLLFLRRAKGAIQRTLQSGEQQTIQTAGQLTGLMSRAQDQLKIEAMDELMIQEFKNKTEIHAPSFIIPEKFKHVDLERLHLAEGAANELKSVLKSIHPWSSLHYGLSALDTVLRVYTKTIPEYFGSQTEIQVLTPQIRGSLGTLNLNRALQNETNPQRPGTKEITFGDRVFREGDRVIQTRNNYDLGVYNGDIGKILSIDLEDYQCEIQFGKQTPIIYQKEDLTEISLAYGITIHKSQGSEFDSVIIPVATQHFKMLFRNLIYTGLTRAKKCCIFVGSRKALSMAIRQIDQRKRQTALTLLVES